MILLRQTSKSGSNHLMVKTPKSLDFDQITAALVLPTNEGQRKCHLSWGGGLWGITVLCYTEADKDLSLCLLSSWETSSGRMWSRCCSVLTRVLSQCADIFPIPVASLEFALGLLNYWWRAYRNVSSWLEDAERIAAEMETIVKKRWWSISAIMV